MGSLLGTFMEYVESIFKMLGFFLIGFFKSFSFVYYRLLLLILKQLYSQEKLGYFS